MKPRRGTFRVLAVEDNPGDADLLHEYLAQSDHDWGLTTVGTLSEALERLADEQFDVILLDLGLPDAQGMRTLERVLEAEADVPVVVVTGHTEKDVAWEAVERGAHDFLLKNELNSQLLERSLRYTVERAAVERALRRERDRLETVLDLSVVGIYMLDDRGRFAYVNQRLCETLGRDRSELLGQPPESLTVEGDRDRVRRLIRERLSGDRKDAHYTVRALAGDGSTIDLDVHGQTITVGARTMIIGAARDISEVKELQRQLLQAQKMEAVGRLAGGVAHDFNNLLTVVAGNLELLLEELPEGDARRMYVKEVKEATDQAAGLTRSLLILGQRDTLRGQAADLHEAILSLKAMFRRLLAEDIELSHTLEAQRTIVTVDSGRLQQLIMNLLVNARDAMPKGGKIVIETTDDPERAREWDPGLVTETEPPASWVYLRVADSGLGIPEEDLSRIFDPFFTTKGPQKGSGLGLSTVYGIVTDAGGEISAGSSPLGGAQFVARLPRAPEPERKAEEETVSASDEGRGRTVLLVEDETAVRIVVGRILERGGYRVVEVGNPREAVQRFREAGDVALLVSDIIMPGLHGPEVVQELRSLDPGLRVLFMSGYSEEETVEKVGELEAEVLSKPFRPSDLLEAVARTLEG